MGLGMDHAVEIGHGAVMVGKEGEVELGPLGFLWLLDTTCVPFSLFLVSLIPLVSLVF